MQDTFARARDDRVSCHVYNEAAYCSLVHGKCIYAIYALVYAFTDLMGLYTPLTLRVLLRLDIRCIMYTTIRARISNCVQYICLRIKNLRRVHLIIFTIKITLQW